MRYVCPSRLCPTSSSVIWLGVFSVLSINVGTRCRTKKHKTTHHTNLQIRSTQHTRPIESLEDQVRHTGGVPPARLFLLVERRSRAQQRSNTTLTRSRRVEVSAVETSLGSGQAAGKGQPYGADARTAWWGSKTVWDDEGLEKVGRLA